jgi:hypothetical protein
MAALMAKANRPTTLREAAAEMTALIVELRHEIEASNAQVETTLEASRAGIAEVLGAGAADEWVNSNRLTGEKLLKFTRHRLWEIFAELASRDLTDDQLRALFKLH